MTNSFFSDNVLTNMFAARFISGFKKERRARKTAMDTIAEQVKKVLKDSDQKLILMVRG